MGTGRRYGALAALLVLGVALAGCGAPTDNRPPPPPPPAAAGDKPFEIAGSATSTGPSGPRPGIPDAPLQAENGDGGSFDTLALNSLADLDEFWKAEYGKNFPGTFTPVTRYLSWDAKAPRAQAGAFCRADTFQLVNAAYCPLDHTIGWDRAVLLPALVQRYGPMSVVMVLAHEYGHSIQGQAKLAGFFTPVLVEEQQADCLAGVFLRHVAEGGSKHFTLNTTDGLNKVLATTIAVRDRDPSDPRNAHGSAFERTTALQIGWTDGAQGCKKITRKEIQQRRGMLPVTFEPGEELSQLPVDVPSLTLISRALERIYPLQQPVKYDYSGAPRSCPKFTATQPVSYCPPANTVGAEVSALARLGAKMRAAEDPLGAVVDGDYKAFAVFISRYVLAVQQERGLSLTGAETAGLRTACLTGVVTARLSEPGGEVRLSAGDLDEAVSGLLTDGAVAADVNGKVVPSGSQRLEAFRTGVLDGESACLIKFR